jgi:hypothetical protein
MLGASTALIVAQRCAAATKTKGVTRRRRQDEVDPTPLPMTDDDASRDVAMLRAERVILDGMIRDAKHALKEAHATEQKILLLAKEPWRLVSGGERLAFTAAALRNDARAVAAGLPKAADRQRAMARLRAITPKQWSAAAKANAAIRHRLETALDADSELKPDPGLIAKLRSMPHVTGAALAKDPKAALEPLHLDGAVPRKRSTDASMKADWLAMTEAIAERGTAGATATKALWAMADRITGLDL